MNNIVRVGLVGAGSISVRGIIPHLSQEDVQDRVRITAVCDPFPGRAQAAAEKFKALPWGTITCVPLPPLVLASATSYGCIIV